MDHPLVTIITPTWQRHDRLLNRCIPSVDAQTYTNVEHLVVSDGPDPELAEKLFPPRITSKLKRWFAALPEHEESLHWGHLARLHGLELASGELIGYLDDDDALRPEHVELLAAALAEHPEKGWAYSQMEQHSPGGVAVIGVGPPAAGNIGTPMVMHRREVLEHGTWAGASAFEDWHLVRSWIQAGIGYTKVDEVTIDVYPSAYGSL
jgi:glycosyltransferase involved in cell wall biosynthesis